MIRDLAKLEEPLVKDVRSSVCIIGSGPAGVVASKILAEAMMNVVVLESGPYRDAPDTNELNLIHQPTRTYRRAEDGRQRRIGGTSTAWGGCLLPLEENDLGERPYLGLKGWPISASDLAPFLHGIEDLFHIGHDPYSATALDTRYRKIIENHPNLKARLPKFPDIRHRSLYKQIILCEAKYDNLTIWCNATVCDFECLKESGSIVSVLAKSLNGRSMRVTSNAFIISCGTLESTRLLLLLDKKSGYQAFTGCDALGRYFNDHLKIDLGVLRRKASAHVSKIYLPHAGGKRRSVHLEITPDYQRRKIVGSGYLSMRFDQLYGAGSTRDGGADNEHIPKPTLRTRVRETVERFAPSLSELGARMLHRFSFGVLEARIEQVPQRSSRIALTNEVDALGVPLLSMNWTRSEDDKRTFAALFEVAQDHWSRSQHTMLWRPEPPDSLLDHSIDTCHPAGSARMGWCRSNSVVDRDMRCHNVKNLYVASAAVFPTSGSVNPTLSIMQLSAWVATAVIKTFL